MRGFPFSSECECKQTKSLSDIILFWRPFGVNGTYIFLEFTSSSSKITTRLAMVERFFLIFRSKAYIVCILSQSE